MCAESASRARGFPGVHPLRLFPRCARAEGVIGLGRMRGAAHAYGGKFVDRSGNPVGELVSEELRQQDVHADRARLKAWRACLSTLRRRACWSFTR